MWQEQTIDLDSGRSLFALQAGEGPDLVLIHGALTTSHDWRVSPAAELAREFRVTVIDRPGHGHSKRSRFSGTPREQADQIAEGLERLGIERPMIAAHSFGGLVTLAHLLPNARLTEIEGAGHMIHHTHPDVVLKVIHDAVTIAVA